MKTYDAYRAQPVAANGTYVIKGQRMAGFVPSATGTITVTDADGTTLLAATTVTAGIVLWFPIHFNTPGGGSVTLASNAAGTLLL